MFTTIFIAFIAALGTTTAAVLPPRPAITPRQASAGSFAITNFDVEAQSGSDAVYIFDVADLSTSPSNFTTSCFASTATSPGLGDVPSTYCADPSVYFDFTNNGTGYVLDIVHLWGEDVHHAIVSAHDDFTDFGSMFFPNDRLVDGAAKGEPFLAKIESYPTFTVPYDRQA